MTKYVHSFFILSFFFHLTAIGQYWTKAPLTELEKTISGKKKDKYIAEKEEEIKEFEKYLEWDKVKSLKGFIILIT
jgi:hypothetical protein